MVEIAYRFAVIVHSVVDDVQVWMFLVLIIIKTPPVILNKMPPP